MFFSLCRLFDATVDDLPVTILIMTTKYEKLANGLLILTPVHFIFT